MNCIRSGLAAILLLAMALAPLAAVEPAVAMGSDHGLYLADDGSVWAWGANGSGQLGDGGTSPSYTPKLVPGLANIIAIGAGQGYSLALRGDGTVWAWGNNDYGQIGQGDSGVNRLSPIQISSLTGVKAITAGAYFAMALLYDGRAFAWGYNGTGCCGTGNTTSPTSTPTLVTGGITWRSLYAAGIHALGIDGDGQVWSWGWDANGQLGDGGSNSSKSSPVAIGLYGATQVVGTYYASAALLGDGTVRTWGNNSNGELAIGNGVSGIAVGAQGSGYSSAPTVTISGGGGSGATATASISLNKVTTITVVNPGKGYTSAPTVTISGGGGSGATATASYGLVDADTPVTTGIIAVSRLATGHDHFIGVREVGTYYTWGANGSGQCQVAAPNPVIEEQYGTDISIRSPMISGWGDSTAVILGDGTVQIFGSNSSGVFGTGSLTPTTSVAAVTTYASWPLSRAIAVANGQYHGAALRADGSVWSWGSNGFGQLGNGTQTMAATPVRSGYFTGARAISSGGDYGDFTLALLTDGSIYAWGKNDYGQAGYAYGGPIQSILVTAGGSGYSSAPTVTISGGGGSGATATATLTGNAVTAVTVTNVGSGYTGQATVSFSGGGGSGAAAKVNMMGLNPGSVSGITYPRAIAAGDFHGLAIDYRGYVYAWGRNSYGQLGNSTTTDSPSPVRAGTLSSIVAVAAGGQHSLALAADGTVWTWGYGANGRLGDGGTGYRSTPYQIPAGTLSGVIAIAAGTNHSLALCADGRVWAWGANGNGQLGNDSNAQSLVPTPVYSGKFYLSGWIHFFYYAKSIAAGDNHSLGINSDGSVTAWGNNSYGQLGIGVGDVTERWMASTVVSGSQHAVGIDGGYILSHGVNAQGMVAGWGNGGSNKIGDGYSTQREIPVETTRNWLPEISLDATDAAAAENPADNGLFTFSRRASDCLVGSQRIDYTIATGTGKAANTTDYATISGTVIIPPAATEVTVNVVPVNDAEFESDETVDLTVATASTAYAIASGQGSATVTIVSDERPTVTSVTTPSSWTAGPGQSVTITVNFNRNVNVAYISGWPRLQLETGATDRFAAYSSGSGTSSLTFIYTVQAGDSSADLEYLSTAALELNGGTIKDSATTYNAILALPALYTANSLGGGPKQVVVDGIAPTVTRVDAPAAADGTWIKGQQITIEVTFSEAVTVVGTPTLTLETGTVDAVVNYSSGSGTNVLSFIYSIGDGHESPDLSYVGTGSLSAGTSIKDLGGNNANRTLPIVGAAGSLSLLKNLVVDGKAPVVTAVTASTANGTYGEGAIIAVQVVFDQTVYTSGTPRLTLETGASDAVVNYSSGSGSSILVFNYTVAQNHASADLDCLGTGSLALNGGTIADRGTGGNPATLTLPVPGAANSLGTNKAIVIEAVRPTVTAVSATNADGSYGVGATIDVTVTFNEAVNVGTGGGTPTIALETGATDMVASYLSGSGTATITFRGTVAAGHVSSDLDYVSASVIVLNGGTIKDLVASNPNNAVLALPTAGAAGSLKANKAIVIDGVAPTVAQVSSATADGWYNAGDTLYLTVRFSEKVDVTGTPQLTLETGGTDAVVNYSSGSGTDTLTFAYLVANGHTSADLDCVSTGALALNGGTIKDQVGSNANPAVLSVPVSPTAGALAVGRALVVDTTVPGISSGIVAPANLYVTVTAGEGLYTNSDGSGALTVADFALAFVKGAGTATSATVTSITNNAGGALVGGESVVRLYLSVGGTANGQETVEIRPSSGTQVYDRAGNAMLAAATTTPLALKDLRGPQVTAVTSAANGWYNALDDIDITVTFDEAVVVNTGGGAPRLLLETGSTDRYATYQGGTGTTVLTFRYQVQDGDVSGDLDYVAVGSLEANGGTLRDAAANNAGLTLPTPGAAGSLAANTAIVIDTTMPAITAGSVGPLNAYIDVSCSEGAYDSGQAGLADTDFLLAYTGAGLTNVQIDAVKLPGGVAPNYGGDPVGGETTLRLVISYTGTADGDDYVEIAPASGAQIYDRAGNPMSAASTTGAKQLIDTSAPYVTGVTASDGFYKAGESLIIIVGFDVFVDGTVGPAIALNSGGTATFTTSGLPNTQVAFQYVVGAGDSSADLDYSGAGALTLGAGSISKAASPFTAAVLTLPTPGTAGSLGFNQNAVIDTTTPTITGAVLAADNSYVDITFSEGVYTTAKASVNVGSTGGLVPADFTWTGIISAITSVTQVGGGATVGGETTVRVNLNLASIPTGAEQIKLMPVNGSAVFDRCGNAMAGGAETALLSLHDQRGPRVTAVTSPNDNVTPYGVGSVIELRVLCDEPVEVTGSPTLTLETGGTDAVAVFAGVTGGNVLVFTFTVAAPQVATDLDCVAATPLALNGGTIRDAAGNNLVLASVPVGVGTSGALVEEENISIDTAAPQVQSVTSSTGNGSYGIGSTVTITVTFSENVTVAGGTPRLGLETGAIDALVNYTSGSGGNVLTFTYTVAAGHVTADLEYLSTGALDASGATIRDAAGNNAVLTLPALATANSLGGSKAIAIDTTAPTVTGVTSTLSDGSYAASQFVEIQVAFSEPVAVTGSPTITLETGSPDLVATYASGSATSTLVFTCTTIAGNTTADLDYVSANALVLAGGTIRDALTANGNAAVLTLPIPGNVGSLGANKAIVIDTTQPAVTGVSATAANGSYGAGAVIDIQVAFTEAVTVAATPTLTLETGTVDAVVNYLSGSGSSVLSFRYTVAAGHATGDLDYISAAALAGSIVDAAGNAAVLALPAPGAAGSLGANKALVIDGVVPVVTSVSSGTANGTYGVGQPVAVTVTFNKAVAVTGTPTLTLETGASDAVVSYVSGSGTNTLTFSYTVAAGHASNDLDYAAAGSLALAGGSIIDTVANNPNTAVLTLPAPGAAGSLGANKAIVIDGVVPTIASVTSPTADGSYTTGAVIPVTVTFSESVTVIGTPQLTLETGASDAVVNYTSGSGTSVLTFTYTVAAGHGSSDLDYGSTGALALNAGTIKDAAGNSAVLTLAAPGAANSLGYSKAIAIDTAVPTVTGITSATANGSYSAGGTIQVQVQFSEPVTITGTPQLTLETGASDAVVNYASGSGTSTIVFTYTVAAGQASTDLDCLSSAALALNGGTIKDGTGNSAVLTLPAPGAAGSLGANKALVIDTAAPTVTGISAGLADGSYAAGQVVPVTVTFSEAVLVAGGTPTLTLETGASDAVVNYFSGSASSVLTFNYTVLAGHNSADLDCVSTAALALAGSTIRDAAGNSAALTLPAPGTAGSLGANKGLVIDTLAPAIASGALAASNAFIDVSFSEGVFTVAGSGALIAADFTLSFSANGGVATGASITGISAVDGSGLVGGENAVRLALAITGTPNGMETIEVRPVGGAAIYDLVGNAASAAATTGVKALNDQSAAYVTAVSSLTVDGTYVAGQAISITVTFSEAVNVSGTPTLVLETGANDTSAVYASGSGTATLVFTYTVAANDVSADLDYQSAAALSLNGGTIRDGSSNNANLTLPTPGQAGSLASAKSLVVDAKAPTVLAVSSPTANGTYSVGATIQVVVTFSEAVNVTGLPQLVLETGTVDAVTTYQSGTGTSSLVFIYTVAAGQNSADLDVTATNALTGTISDLAGNAATLTLPAPGAAGSLSNAKAIVIDTAGPAVTGITSGKPNGTWVAGQTIPIQIQFGEAVMVTGVPQLTLETGVADAVVDYSSGSGTSTLTFIYTVAATHVSSDLDCQSAVSLALNGGSLADTAGNAANLALPVPGAAGSLSANKNLVIITPTVTVAASDGTANEGGDTGAFTISLSQAVSSDLVVGINTAGTATSGGDYVAVPASAVISAGSLGVIVVVTPLNDPVAEGAETIELSLGAGAGYSLGGQTTAVVTLNDDDSAGFIVTPTSGITVSEASGAGHTATFTIRLTSQPTADVTIGLASSNLAEGAVTPSDVVFTAGNWSAPQVVTVTGVDDLVDDGNVSFTVITSAAASLDPRYAGQPVPDVSITCTDDDEAGIVVTPTAGLATSEGGGQASFTIVLASRPTAGVTIGLSSSDATEGVVSPGTITFAPDAWDQPQTVTVVGIDDGESDGNVAYAVVTSAAVSDDPVYGGRVVSDVAVSNADDDSAGVTVTPTSGLRTTTGGGQATFTVVLNSRPTANVTIALASSDGSMGAASPASLVFTSANWDRKRVVTVTGSGIAGAYQITTGGCVSSDPNYGGLAVDDVEVENVNSTAAVIVTPVGGLSTTEYGDVAVFSVRLASAPTGNVVIPLRVSHAGEGDLGGVVGLTFTPANFNAPQVVVVTGVDDDVEDGNVAYAVILDPATSADPLYDGFDAPDVQVINADDDTRGVTVTHVLGGALNEAGTGARTYDIVLDSEPTGTVVIAVSAGDQMTLSSSSFTFGPGDWDVAQQLVVSVVDDSIDESATHFGELQFSAIGGGYSQVAIAPISVPILDNDTAAIVVSPVAGLVTSESGAQASFTVSLSSQPTANVTVLFASSDTGEGSVPATITFTPGSWQIPQMVAVTGADDSIDDGDQPFTITTSAVSADGIYNAIDPADVSVTNQDDTDEAGVLITPTSGLNVAESAASEDHSRSFSVSLRTRPTADVTISLSTSDAAAATVSPATLTFTAANWATPQTATVTGVDDDVDDGDQNFTIATAVIAGADVVYNALDPVDVTGRCLDDDTAGVSVSVVSGSTTEVGGTATFTVVLTAQPTADVAIPLASAAPGEVSVASGAVLTFTSGNWSTPQTVTLAGEDDAVDDGDRTVSIILLAAVSLDQRYGGDGASVQAINPADVAVSNLDDDTVGVVVTHSGADTAVTEGGAVDTYEITLASQPTGTVSILIEHDDQVEVDPEVLTITSGDWQTPHTVTVRAVDDRVAEGLHAGSVQHVIVSADDAGYDDLDPVGMGVSIADNESVGVSVLPSSGLATTEAGGSAQFFVMLDSRPTANVVIGLSSANLAEGTALPASLTFTPLNWDVAQAVTVTGVDDAVDDGNIVFSIVTTAAISTDPAYNGFDPADVSVTNQDNDGAGVVITQSTGTTQVGEAGTTDSYTVILGSAPLANVTITLAPSAQVQVDTDAVTAGDQNTLVFTPANWNQVRTVAVRATQDSIVEDDPLLVLVTHAAASADPAYNGTSVIPVQVAVWDDDEAGVVVSPTSGLVTSETGLSAGFTVVLTSQPVADVTVALSSGDAAEGTVAPANLTFTSGNWNVPQAVTATGVDDGDLDGASGYQVLTGAAVSADARYQGLAVDDVDVVNLDDDGPGLVLAMTGNDLAVAEGGASDSFSVCLSADPGAGNTVTVVVDGGLQLSTDFAVLTFDDGNWGTPQWVAVTAVNDAVVEGVHEGTVGLSASETGAVGFGGIILDLGVAIADNDHAGVTVAPGTTLVVDEAGSTASFTVVLDSDPVVDVTVLVSVSDAGQGSIVTGMPLTFTGGGGGSWAVPQTVTVAGVDNGLDEGDVPFVVRFATASANPQYAARAVPDLQAVNRAVNDTPTIDAANLTIDEDAGAQSIALYGIGAGQAGESQTLAVSLLANSNAALTGATVLTHVSPGAAGTLAFTPAANASGAATLQFQVADDGSPAASATRTITVTINPVNDAPSVTVGGSLHVNRGLSNLLDGVLLAASDVEDAAATLTYTIYLKPPQGWLELFDGVVWNELDTNDTFTQDDVDMGRVRYAHNNSSGGSDGFAFTVKDSGIDSTAVGAPLETALRIMNIVIDDTDPPLVQIPAADLVWAENAVAVQVAPAPSGTVGDSDSPSFAGGYLQVAISAPVSDPAPIPAEYDELSIVPTGTGAGQISVSGTTVSYGASAIGTIRSGHTGSNGEDLIVDFSGGDDEAAEALLRTIHYRYQGENPPPAVRVLSVEVNDGDGGTSNLASGSQLVRNLVITLEDDIPYRVDPDDPDRAPLAGDPWFATVLGMAITRQVEAVDPEGTVVTYALTDGHATAPSAIANGLATLGTVTIDVATGVFIYTPAAGISGQDDAFWVTATDGTGQFVNIHVRIHITGPEDADAPRFASNPPMHSYDQLPLIYQAAQVGGTTGALVWRLVDAPAGAPFLSQTGNLNWNVPIVPGDVSDDTRIIYHRFGILVEDTVLHRAAFQPIFIKVAATPAGDG